MVTIISNDWHIKPSNVDEIIDLTKQKIQLAKKHSIKKVFILGDIFQSRQSQPLSVLKCFEQVLDLFDKGNVEVIVTPGNHDKTNYESYHSFLDSFSWHPALLLMNGHDSIQIDDINFICIPFFSNDIWLKELEESRKLINNQIKYNILLSHIAFNGSVNNDGSKVENKIKPELVKDFDAVFLGHYHNYHKVSKEIYHLPCLQQNNFGEDSNKGFTLIKEDGSFEIVKSKFKEFLTVEVDANTLTKKEISKMIKSTDPKENYVRIKVKGSEDKVKSLKLDEFKVLGYDIKTEHEDILTSIKEVELGKIIEFNESLIIEEFKMFCQEEGFDEKSSQEGMFYIKKSLKDE